MEATELMEVCWGTEIGNDPCVGGAWRREGGRVGAGIDGRCSVLERLTAEDGAWFVQRAAL